MGVNPPPSERKIKYGQEERIKMTRLRQTIAKRLKQAQDNACLLYTSPSPRDFVRSRMPSSA